MSRSVNKIILVGNIGQDPDIQETGSGTKVAHLSLATNRRSSNNGDEPVERTDWHRLTLWNRLAQFTEDYVHKGDRVYVEGRLEYDSYERDGVTIPTADVVVRELVLLSPRSQVEATAD
jgi:single-strand DNA-binding protein